MTDPVKQMWDDNGAGSDDEWGALTVEPSGVSYRDAGPDLMWVEPDGAAQDKVIFVLHGGGFVSGSFASHRKLAGHLASAAGTRALLVHYRLAPEHVFPAQLEDAVGAYRWLAEQGVAIALAGDSCAGSLGIGMLLRARELGLPLPAAIFLMSPWTDLEQTGTSFESNAGTDLFFTRAMVQGLADLYLRDGASPKDPLVNALYADLTGFPPLYLQVGADESLLEDARMLARHARSAGVEVLLDEFPGQLHTFQMAAGRTAVADDAIGRFAQWVSPRF